MTKKLIEIPSSPEKIFKHYLMITKPLNKLTPKEIDLLSHILYLNHIEKDNFKSEDDKWLKIFSTKSRQQIIVDLDINDYDFNNMLSSLRKKKVIMNNQVQKYFIPQIDENGFELVFQFKFNKK